MQMYLYITPAETAQAADRSRGRNRLGLEQLPQQLRSGGRLRDTVRLVVVVEEGVRLLALSRQLAQRPDPFAQLLVGVRPVEALRGAAAALVPRPGVSPVEAHVGERRGRGDDRGRDILRVGLRR